MQDKWTKKMTTHNKVERFKKLKNYQSIVLSSGFWKGNKKVCILHLNLFNRDVFIVNLKFIVFVCCFVVCLVPLTFV